MLDFYTQQSAISQPGKHADLYDASPDDVPGLVKTVQGVLIQPYPFILSLHGLRLKDIDNTKFGIRPIEGLLDRILSNHNASLNAARPPRQRIGANCRNFATLLVSMLRHKGIPARERIGFAGYLGGKIHYEHRITQYWNGKQKRWVLVDAWVDDVLGKARNVQFNPLDIQPDAPFLLSGDVWTKSRQNELDPNQFGDSDTDIGMPMVRYALLHDFDALNKLEVLGSDAWGELSEKPEAELTPDDLHYLDRVAELTTNPDATFDELIAFHATTTYGKAMRAQAQTLGLL